MLNVSCRLLDIRDSNVVSGSGTVGNKITNTAYCDDQYNGTPIVRSHGAESQVLQILCLCDGVFLCGFFYIVY